MTDEDMPPGGTLVPIPPPWDAWRPADVARLLAAGPDAAGRGAAPS
jgi:hypothetical protein